MFFSEPDLPSLILEDCVGGMFHRKKLSPQCVPEGKIKDGQAWDLNCGLSPQLLIEY